MGSRAKVLEGRENEKDKMERGGGGRGGGGEARLEESVYKAERFYY